MLSRRRRAFHLRRVMLAAGLWMKLRKRRRCAPTSRQDSENPLLTATKKGSDETMDVEDVMDGAPSDDNFEPPQPRGPVRSRKPPTRKPGEEGDTLPSGPKPRKIQLLRSVFEGRPPVVLFSYTQACCAEQRPLDRAVPADEDGPRMFYSHTDAIHQYNAVINILRHGGLYRVRAETNRWTVLWSLHPTPEQLQRFSPVQRANHFPGSYHLGRKDLIWRNLAKMQQRFGKEYQITPQGYILPKAFLAWDAARLRQSDALWIWKPCSQSCGRGITVLSSDVPEEQLRDLAKKRGIIQRYIPNPLLIGGRKFDMRIYVVVLSYDPLKVFINDEGLVRFATELYSDAVETLQSRMMHLTNYSVNKQNPAFVQNLDGQGEEEKEDAGVDEAGQPKASKWSLKELRIHFARESLDFDALWEAMKDLVIKTLISVEEPLKADWCKTLGIEDGGWSARGPGGAHRGSCFEIYGFDILVDRSLKPWLLEVNICPSLSSGSPLDKRIKTKLVADVLTLVGVHPPAALWKLSPESVHWPASGNVSPSDDNEAAAGCLISEDEMRKRALKLVLGTLFLVQDQLYLAGQSPQEAVSLFDEVAWELVVEAHDQEMRSGGLEMAFPCPNGSRYVQYWGEESYCNLVLRKWQEAGGDAIFRSKKLPPWVPRQVCFSKT
ncbi:unnamed protein product [Durusdinium trenchii]|uniref:Tubulin--tyrosine ligase-like protein 5 n=1 Tax=Durusdinium trenchii TaxID=1381693 RepID=A0ABP0RE58_9DINO